MLRLVTALLGFILVIPVATLAGQTTIPNYNAARDSFFWSELYSVGGQGIYCGTTFGPGERLTVEHAYPAHWIAEANGCDNRNNCPLPEYGFAEADLHNLWPARGNINSSRGKLKLSEIPGEDHRRFTDICPDYERTSGSGAVVEPRNEVKGNLARSILYMAMTYDLPLKGSGEVLLRWHKNDPPDDHEVWRNNKIEELQGTRNPYIDDCGDER